MSGDDRFGFLAEFDCKPSFDEEPHGAAYEDRYDESRELQLEHACAQHERLEGKRRRHYGGNHHRQHVITPQQVFYAVTPLRTDAPENAHPRAPRDQIEHRAAYSRTHCRRQRVERHPGGRGRAQYYHRRVRPARQRHERRIEQGYGEQPKRAKPYQLPSQIRQHFLYAKYEGHLFDSLL